MDTHQKSFRKQIAIIVASALVAGVLLAQLNAVETFYLLTERADNWFMDDMAGVFVASAIAMPFIVWRWHSHVNSEVKARLEAEKAGRMIARLDILTGLPNRFALEDKLGSRPGVATDTADYLLMMDLNRFKPLNDLRGQDAGDVILRKVGARLLRLCGPSADAYRMGGDEFAILFCDVRNEADAVGLAKKIVETIAQPFVVEDWRETLTCSVGIAKFSDGASPTELTNNADQAMYFAKANVAEGWAMFDDALGDDLREKALLAADLRDAVHSNALVPFFQPILTIDKGDLIGFEVLARWQRGDHGFVPPDVFIPLAEELGLIDRLSDQLLRLCCAAMADWDPQLTISFNLSPTQLNHDGLAKRIGRILDECGIPGHRLAIEITETAVFIDMDRARRIISELRDLGVRVSLDDFGIGTSSLAVLSQLPFDTIKIDRTFVSDVEQHPQNAKIVRGVLALARSLELTVTAEGIESSEDLAFLKDNNCVLGQGYFFSRPVPEDAIPQLIEDVARTAAEGRGVIAVLPPAVEQPTGQIDQSKGRSAS